MTEVDFTRNFPDFILGKGGDPRFSVLLPIPERKKRWIRRAVRNYDKAKNYLRSLEGGSPTTPSSITASSHPGFLQMLDFVAGHPGMRYMAEIGTFLGEATAVFAKHFETVLTCDPWEPQFMQDMFGRPVSQGELLDTLEKNLAGAEGVAFKQMSSLLTAQDVANGAKDFVYIDGWHRVMPCLVDIITWLPKIRPGGFIGGHDYSTKSYSEVIPAVRYTLGFPDYVFSDSSWLKKV